MRSPEEWTRPEDVRAKVQRLWDTGRLLACALTGEELFPLRLPLRRPKGPALAAHFEAARAWVRALEEYVKSTTFAPPGALNYDSGAIRTAFAGGQVAMNFDWGDTRTIVTFKAF